MLEKLDLTLRTPKIEYEKKLKELQAELSQLSSSSGSESMLRFSRNRSSSLDSQLSFSTETRQTAIVICMGTH